MFEGIEDVAQLYAGSPDVDRIIRLMAGRTDLGPRFWTELYATTQRWASARGKTPAEGERMYEHVRARVEQQVRVERGQA